MITSSKDAVGKAGVYIRHFLMNLEETEKPMREVQTYALGKAECSVPYASVLTKQMMEDGLIDREKIGRKYFVKITDEGIAFLEWAIENHFGVDAVIESDISVPDDGVVMRNQLSKGNWRLVMEVKRERRWLTALVPAGYDVYIRPKDDKTARPTKLKEI